jgi:hypothetical protein
MTRIAERLRRRGAILDWGLTAAQAELVVWAKIPAEFGARASLRVFVLRLLHNDGVPWRATSLYDGAHRVSAALELGLTNSPADALKTAFERALDR